MAPDDARRPYPRGNKLWFRLKDENGKWKSKPTPYHVGQEKEARRYAAAAQKQVDQNRADDVAPPLTVREFLSKWSEKRELDGVATFAEEKAGVETHMLPLLGHLRLEDVRPRHIRDAVMAFKKENAPRTVRRIYGTLHVMFEHAVVDELIIANPCKLKRGVLPVVEDKDPEWRANATYTIPEVEQLISDDRIPVERRVMYALKAIGGLRHGEAAAVRWRSYDPTMEPLGRLLVAEAYDSRKCKLKSTKTKVPRRVPVHPALAKILAAWKVSHWERIYGRAPTQDDFIVPTRLMTPVNVSKVPVPMRADLRTLGLRVEAGEFRARGGHDLRAWFITALQEAEAHRDLLGVITHTAKKDVMSGYTRVSWGALCAQVLKLRISAEPRGQVLPLATVFATVEKQARNRWGKAVRAEGLEGAKNAVHARQKLLSSQERDLVSAARDASDEGTVAKLATVVLLALEGGDRERALALLDAAREAPSAPSVTPIRRGRP